MVDFTKYDASTHPTIKAVDDYNSIVDHAFEKLASFIVFKRTISAVDYYYAQYGSGADQAGKIAYGGPNNVGGVSGTNAAAILQKTLDFKKDFAIGPGTFPLGATGLELANIVLADGFNIRGAGQGLTTLTYTGSAAALKLNAVDGLRLSDFRLVGSTKPAGSIGLHLYNSHYNIFENVLSQTFETEVKLEYAVTNLFKNFRVFDGTTGFLLTRILGVGMCNNNLFIGCRAASTSFTYPFHIEYGYSNVLYKCCLEGNSAATAVVYLSKEGMLNIIDACWFEANAGYDILINNTDNNAGTIQTIKIRDCIFDSIASTRNIKVGYATGVTMEGNRFSTKTSNLIELTVNSVNPRVINNDLKIAGANAIINNSTTALIKWNEGYVTENSGTATFSGTGAQTVFTIAHGCALTPTHVNLEAKSADASGDKYWSADATNITVTFKTAPPLGTNNVVIGWKAEV